MMTKTVRAQYLTQTVAIACLVAVVFAVLGARARTVEAAGMTGQWYTANVTTASPTVAITWPASARNNTTIEGSGWIDSSPVYTNLQLLAGGNGTLYCSTNIGGISLGSNTSVAPWYSGITLDSVYGDPTITCHVKFTNGIWSKPIQHTFAFTPVTINSWNCPEQVLNGQSFSCLPNMTVDLTSAQQAGAVYTWSADNGALTQSATNIPNPQLVLSGAGSAKLTLAVRFPDAGNIVKSFTMPTAITIGTTTITGMTCPARIIENEDFTCVPQMTSTGMTEEQKAGAVYTWTSDTGALTQSNTSTPDAVLKLTGGTNANAKITLSVSYPNANNYTIGNETTVPYSYLRVASLGCPSGPIKPPFSCSPRIESSLTEVEKAGAVYTWASDNGVITAEHSNVPWGNINFTNYENKTTNVTMYATYPGFGGRTISGAKAIQLNSAIADYQPVCPAVVKRGNPIECAQTPSVTEGVYWFPPDYLQTGASVYSSTYHGGFSFTESGEKEIHVKYPNLSKNIKVIVADAAFNATNCPAEVYANEPFRCNPAVTTFPADYPKTANEFSWEGTGLQVNPDGSMQYNTLGTKTITGRYNSNHYANPAPPAITAEFPENLAVLWGAEYTRWNITKTQDIVVKNRTMSITSAGCPETTLTTKKFTCTPVISSDIPAELQKDIVYTWAGDGLVVNPDKSLQFTTGGAKTVVVTATYPGISAKTATATVNVIVPQWTHVSLDCPESVFLEESFRCTDEASTNLPEEYKTGATKTWAAEGLTINQDGSMKFTTEGAKTATFTMIYPLASYQSAHQKTITVIKPTFAITALNCPVEVLANEQFTCTPEITTNLPANYLNNIRKTWTGTDVVPKNNNYVTFNATGQKTLNVRFDYPGAETVNATANITVWGSTVNIVSLGCPAEPKVQEAFRCTPVIETDMSQEHQSKLTYSWTGLNIDMADDGSMAMTSTGTKSVTLVVALPEKNITFKKTELINVAPADTTIKSLGCPAVAYFGNSFTCTPEIETTASFNNLQYAWSGTDLESATGGQMTMAQSGNSKKITLTVTNPDTGLRLQKTESMNIIPIVVSIEGHGCSTKIKGMQPFKCAPAIKTNVPEIKEGLNYTWSGPELVINEAGSLMFKTEGTKTVSLRITHSNYPQVQVEKSFTLEVTGLSLEVLNLGCSKNITEYVYVSCTPKISSDLSAGDITYDWQLNGESVGKEKTLKLLTKAPGTSTVSLSVKIIDPETKAVAAESSLSQELTVAPNTGRLKLYIAAPSRAELGTSVTLEAKTVFQVDEIIDYTWIVNGTEYKGKVITVPVPAEQAEPIPYSVTAKPNCCEGIIAETREGIIKTTEYKFPNIAFTGPSNAAVNVAPFEATFKTAVVTTSNLTYTWNFGDGSPLEVTDKTATRMKHTYTTPGTYTAILSVRDKNNEVREFQADVTVMPLPERELEIKTTMSNEYIRRPVTGFFKYGIRGGLRRDTPVSNSWSINNEVVSEKPSARIDFPEAGTHTVNLEVKTKYGNVLHESTTVEVKENTPPQCEITKEPFGTDKYKLTANCSDSDGKVVRYKWDLGGGVTSSSSKAYLTTKTAGDYPVSLTATDDSGDSVTVNDTVSASGGEAPAGE